MGLAHLRAGPTEARLEREQLLHLAGGASARTTSPENGGPEDTAPRAAAPPPAARPRPPAPRPRGIDGPRGCTSSTTSGWISATTSGTAKPARSVVAGAANAHEGLAGPAQGRVTAGRTSVVPFGAGRCGEG